ncbi:chorismate synthase [Aneurinibacillus aneurinilyticus]|jgi:chorismate synthase|uniref:Chorismate synthase n=2 Tax=Aneurinibacillus aneurinilyticus TaxID=1391 RepID=A0A848CM29_ANEAE|nr:chorismate synthase [Aneurinibacillus aneurinilyticus]ERI08360.1 chorismate synthase [Aneurinibacillus aneurinilyticus ATCC 12856]MCI1692967.1 chorismate synthase [Aneurinibacillus aneurinilyticus]MED0669861.1 chorismate synthase [Aneurinibacillus aneurinilyticus]MED0705770.1 chorismate synthase [Aneurinibacillus aneurinilyticus]MED0725761.1 chorismate synthase [Aneurinibacillus aneurinilyticus]
MRYLTAGESHGPQLTAIIEGVPSNLPISVEKINEQLLRRMKGHGRGRRMQIEKDEVKIVGGVRHGKTTGAPICLVVENKDWTHWQKIMSPEPVEEGEDKRRVSRPRPGHADLNGALKYNQYDMRNILERSSARETAIRVAVGAVARQLLEQFDIAIAGHVLRIGEVEAKSIEVSLEEMIRITEESPVRCLDSEAAQKMMDLIDKAKADGDSLGGVVEVIAEGLPIGLGSHVQWDRKLDGRLAQAVMSIQAFKGVEVGIGFEAAVRPGSQVHDEIVLDEQGRYSRRTNRAGGLEGGMTTGLPVVVRGVMKPIPTLYKPLGSIDIDTKEPFAASIERSDSCAVPAASVVAEAVVSWTLADALCEKFAGDSLEEMKANYESYLRHVEEF